MGYNWSNERGVNINLWGLKRSRVESSGFQTLVRPPGLLLVGRCRKVEKYWSTTMVITASLWNDM